MTYKDEAHLDHILKCIAVLPQHMDIARGSGKWFEHITVREAVLRTLQTMSESCNKLSEEAKLRVPEIDWKQINGFRNVLAHDYLGDIDYEKINKVIKDDIPRLRVSVSRIYKELFSQ